MPRNGSGQYSLPSGNPVVTNTVISSSGWANPTLSDIAAAITDSIAADGQTVPSANLPMGNFRHTGVANAQNRTDYAAAGQVQDSSLIYLTSIAGTDTITASSAPAITAYVAGQHFNFLAAGANATNAVTLNINGLGAKSVTRNGSTALSVGDIAAGSIVSVVYDGTEFQLQSQAAVGRLLGIRYFTSSTTYTPSTGTNFIVVEIQGGGGAGGGAPATGAATFSIGAGGSAGAFLRKLLTSGFSGASIVVGAAGSGSAGLPGGSGGTSSFGGTYSCTGGSGGGAGGPQANTTYFIATYNGGGAASNGDLNIAGNFGTVGFAYSGILSAGTGANSFYGSGGASANNGTGGAGRGYGAGGGGCGAGPSQSNLTGGAGAPGVVIVYEYA